MYFKEGSSDKEYTLQIVECDAPLTGMYLVNFQYGRRGSTLIPGTKTPTAVSLETAQKIYNKLVAEKIGKGYKVMVGEDNKDYVSVANIPETKKVIFVPQLLNPIDESEIEQYLKDDSYGTQEKINGKHQAFSKKAGQVQVTNKKGQVIGYPETLSKALQSVVTCLIDSEAVGETYYAFDLLDSVDKDMRNLPYLNRYKALESAFALNIFKGTTITLVPLAIGYKDKKAMYDKLKAENKEGIVFKKLDSKYSPGRPSSKGPMLKAKFYAELSARVCQGREGKRSIGLELLNDKGIWVNVGNCTIGGTKPIPSIGSIVEIKYLYCLPGGSLYQPSYKEPRDDIDADECLMTQIKYKPEED